MAAVHFTTIPWEFVPVLKNIVYAKLEVLRTFLRIL